MFLTAVALYSRTVYGISASFSTLARLRPFRPKPTMTTCARLFAGNPAYSVRSLLLSSLLNILWELTLLDIRGESCMAKGVRSIVTTAEARNHWYISFEIRPADKPATASTKENSPTCPRSMAECIDVRRGRLIMYIETKAVMNFSMLIPNTRGSRKTILLIKKDVSMSMPTDMKKMPVKLSLKGRIVDVASCAYSDSEITRPARKAPSASERPNSDVRNAIPKQRIRIVMTNSSRFFVRTT
ncbi:hypothetical protein BMS3Abin09_00026 [bacterium BMS3Abin09]|nr:hypothetical protein BMS3Abin09_00026 [bacterium BMS3Abin09]